MTPHQLAAQMKDALRENVLFTCGHLPEARRVGGPHPKCPTCGQSGRVFGSAA